MGRKAQSEEQRQACKAIRLFQNYTTRLENEILLTEWGKEILASIWGRCGLEVIHTENKNVSIVNVVLDNWDVISGEHEWGKGESRECLGD